MPIRPDLPRNALAAAMLAALVPSVAQAQFTATIQLSSLNGSNSFALAGATADDRFGFAVSGTGDINGDGIDDLDRIAATGGGDCSRATRDLIQPGQQSASTAPIGRCHGSLRTRPDAALRSGPGAAQPRQPVA